MFLAFLVVGARMLCLALLLFQSFFLTLASSESEQVLRKLRSSDNTHRNSSAGHFTLCARECGPPVALFLDPSETIRLYFKRAVPSTKYAYKTAVAWRRASSSDFGKSWTLLPNFLQGRESAPRGKYITEDVSFRDGAFCRVNNQESSMERRVIYDIEDNGKLMPTAILTTKDGVDVSRYQWTKYSFQGVHNFVCLRPENGNDYFTYVLLADGKGVSIVAIDNVRHEFGNGSSSSVPAIVSGREDDFAETCPPNLFALKHEDDFPERCASNIYAFPEQCRSLDHFQLEGERILVIFCWTEEDLKYVVGKWRFEDVENVSGTRWFPGRLEFDYLGSGHLYRGEEMTWKFLDGADHRRPGDAVGVAYSGIISMGWYGGVRVNVHGYREWKPHGSSFMALRELSILENGFVITAKPWMKTRVLDRFSFEIPSVDTNDTGNGMDISKWWKGAGALVFELKCTLAFASYSDRLDISFNQTNGQGQQLRVSLEDKNRTSVTLRIVVKRRNGQDWKLEKDIKFPYKRFHRLGGDSVTVVLDKQTVAVYAAAGRAVSSMAHSIEDVTQLTNLFFRTEGESIFLDSAKLLKYAPVEVKKDVPPPKAGSDKTPSVGVKKAVPPPKAGSDKTPSVGVKRPSRRRRLGRIKPL